MHQRIDHIVKGTNNTILAMFTGQEMTHVTGEWLLPEATYRENALKQPGLLTFYYEYMGKSCSVGELQRMINDAYNELADTASDIRLSSLSLIPDEGKSISIEHDNGVYIIREPFPLHAVEYLEELSERDGYIVDNKLANEIQAALVFGHKDNCQKYREKLGVV